MIDTTRIREQVSVLEVASRLTTLKKIGGEAKGPCPMCGGTDRFSVFKDGRGWMCRKCRPEGGDAIELVKLTMKCDFEQACRFLGFVTDKIDRPEPVRKVSEDAPWTAADWQSRVKAKLIGWQAELRANVDAQDYLSRRGLAPETVHRYQLGFDPDICAIAIPWIGRNFDITAVKLRFVIPPSSKRRFQQLTGSRQIVFGAHATPGASSTVIVEGEFNAMSLAQAIPDCDILSAGGEANLGPLAALIDQCPEPLLWLDDPSKIEKVLKLVRCKPKLLRSPIVDETALDANDILCRYGADILRDLVRNRQTSP